MTVRVTGMVRAMPPLVRVIVAVLVPTTAEVRVTLVVIGPVPVADVGVRESQGALLLAVHVLFEFTVMVWLAGFVPP
ncbi:MAG: hypothetical protein A4E19_12400 [Nitrospira sp. SG-bin1]|nr:MAG: hypothetical protein A4E19_12400 [Nitrospira sp. SG-bin1]